MRKDSYDDVVDHDGDRFHYEGLKVRPHPKRLDLWLGGIAPSELKRVGRMADGWLPSFITPVDAASGLAVIEQVAAEHERRIEDDHYGVLIPYAMVRCPTSLVAQFAGRRPDLEDPASLVPLGWDAVIDTVKRFVDVGTTKFVVVPTSNQATRRISMSPRPQALLPLGT